MEPVRRWVYTALTSNPWAALGKDTQNLPGQAATCLAVKVTKQLLGMCSAPLIVRGSLVPGSHPSDILHPRHRSGTGHQRGCEQGVCVATLGRHTAPCTHTHRCTPQGAGTGRHPESASRKAQLQLNDSFLGAQSLSKSIWTQPGEGQPGMGMGALKWGKQGS